MFFFSFSTIVKCWQWLGDYDITNNENVTTEYVRTRSQKIALWFLFQTVFSSTLSSCRGLSWHARLPLLAVGSDKKVVIWKVEGWPKPELRTSGSNFSWLANMGCSRLIWLCYSSMNIFRCYAIPRYSIRSFYFQSWPAFYVTRFWRNYILLLSQRWRKIW